MRAMKTLNYDLMASVHIARGAVHARVCREPEEGRRVRHRCGGVRSRAGRQQPLLANYANAYKAKYRRDLDDQASLAVTCVGALYDALERAPDLSREALTEALRATDLQAGGNPFVLRDGVKFDQAGDNVRPRAW